MGRRACARPPYRTIKWPWTHRQSIERPRGTAKTERYARTGCSSTCVHDQQGPETGLQAERRHPVFGNSGGRIMRRRRDTQRLPQLFTFLVHRGSSPGGISDAGRRWMAHSDPSAADAGARGDRSGRCQRRKHLLCALRARTTPTRSCCCTAGLGAGEDFGGQIRSLAGAHKVIAIDSRGHGRFDR